MSCFIRNDRSTTVEELHSSWSSLDEKADGGLCGQRQFKEKENRTRYEQVLGNNALFTCLQHDVRVLLLTSESFASFEWNT